MDRDAARQELYRVASLAPWLVSAVAGCIVLWALLGQSAIAAQMGDALRGVRENVALAGDLTRQTADALTPLANTAMTLQSMNGQLASTTADLAAVNGSMTKMVESQQAIFAGLTGLNGHTKELVGLLGDVSTTNDGVLKVSTALAVQTEGEASTLKRLSASAGLSNQHLQTLSRRLAFLRQLPF